MHFQLTPSTAMSKCLGNTCDKNLNFYCVDDCCRYTPGELKYLPVGTAIYGPPKKFKDILAQPSTGDTSDDTAEESGEVRKFLCTKN